MKSENIRFYRQNNMDLIFCLNSISSYPLHTHASHFTIGYIIDGMVSIVCNEKESLYHAGELYYIMPDIPHMVEPVNNTVYSMLSVCIPVDGITVEADRTGYEKKLKQMILEEPEKEFLIKDMAEKISVSQYHMIRQFKAVCGLTPHQFQIQCRVRKGQRLLEEGKSVAEAAYAAGFCDQSHFDRCFTKLLSLPPSVYKMSVY